MSNHISRRLLTVIAFSIPFILTMAVAVPLTETGTRLLISTINKLSPAYITYTSGTLTTNLALASFQLSSEEFSLEVRDIQSKVDFTCLRYLKVCFEFVSAGSIELVLNSSDESDPQLLEGGGPIEFPINLEIRRLSVSDFKLTWDGGSVDLGEVASKLNLRDSSLKVAGATIARSQFRLVQDAVDDKKSPSRISLPTIELPLDLTIGDIRILDTSIEVLNQNLHLNHIELRGKWFKSEVDVDRLLLKHSAWGNLSAKGKIDIRDDWPIQVVSNIMLLEPPISERLHHQTLNLSFTGDLLALEIKVTGTTGEVSHSVSVTVEPLQPDVPFTLSAISSWQHTLSLSDIAPLNLDAEVLTPVNLSVKGNLLTQSFRLDGKVKGLGYRSLGISLIGEHRQSTVHLTSLMLADEPGSDTVDLQGTIALGDRLNWDISVVSAGFGIPAINEKLYGRLNGSFRSSGEISGSTWKTTFSDVDIKGEVSGLPARVEGYLSIDDKLSLYQSKVIAVINDAEISLDSAGNNSNPRIELSIADLSRWSYCSQGSLTLIGSKSATGTGMIAEGMLNDLNCQNFAFESGQLNAEIETDTSLTFDGDIQLNKVSVGTNTLGNIALSAKGDLSKHTLTFQNQGDVEGTLSIEGHYAEDLWTGKLKPTTFATPIGQWTLAETVQLTYLMSSGELNLQNHCWRQMTTNICLSDLLAGENIHGYMSAKGDIDFLDSILPGDIDLDGQLTMDITLDWNTDSGISIDGTSQILDGQFRLASDHLDAATLKWDVAKSTFDFAGQNLNFDISFVREGSKIINANLNLPYEPDQAISGSLLFNDIELEIFKPFLKSFSVLKGILNGTVAVGGTRDQPTGTGGLTVISGQLARVGNKNRLDAIDLTLKLDGNEVDIFGTAEIGSGPLNVTGTMTLQSIPRLELSLKGDSQNLVFASGVQAVISEDLFMVVTQNDFDIKGNVDIQKGFLEYYQLPEGSVVLSDDVVEVDYQGQVIREINPFDISMNLDVTINDFEFANKNLKALVGGKLHLQQQPQRPFQLFGNLNVINGQVNAYGQQLNIQQGTLSFTGAPNNPELALRAERRFPKDNIVVGVSVQGPSDAPNFEVYSIPAMSTTETLSYLIRGRGNDEGAVIDGTALALSFGTEYLNEALLSGFNNRQGISRLAFGTSSNNDNTTATLGGYFGEKLYLSYGIGLYEPVNELTTRFYIQSRFWIDVISSLNNSIDIYYSFDWE